MEVDSLVSFSVSPRLNGYAPEQVESLYDRIEEALAAQPGVTSVASAGYPLIADAGMTFFPEVEGFEDAADGLPGEDRSLSSQSNVVSPGFFETVSIPLLAGRGFTDADIGSAPGGAAPEPNVAIVNDAFVRQFGLGDAALGARFSIPFVAESLEIIGVVADARYVAVKRDVDAQFFVPGRHAGDDTSLSFYVRAGIDADTLVGTIPRVIAEVDPSLPLSELTTMEGQVRDNVYLDRLIAMLSVSFAGLATLLAAIGLYGVLAYNVGQRTRELGLRLALGAAPQRLRAMVLGQVGLMALLGGAVGLAAAIGVGRTAEALLFGLSGYDPRVLLAAAAVLAAVVLAAGYVPARRASSIEPMQALRYE